MLRIHSKQIHMRKDVKIMDKLDILNDRIDRIKVAMDATDSSLEWLIATGACAGVNCNKCPIRDKCDDLNYTDCIDVWYKYLMGEI